MDTSFTGEPESSPTLPHNLVERLLHLWTVAQLELLIEHGEIVEGHGHGFVTATWRDGKPDLIYHQASDKA